MERFPETPRTGRSSCVCSSYPWSAVASYHLGISQSTYHLLVWGHICIPATMCIYVVQIPEHTWFSVCMHSLVCNVPLCELVPMCSCIHICIYALWCEPMCSLICEHAPCVYTEPPAHFCNVPHVCICLCIHTTICACIMDTSHASICNICMKMCLCASILTHMYNVSMCAHNSVHKYNLACTCACMCKCGHTQSPR